MKTGLQKDNDLGRAFGNRTSAIPTKYYLGLSKTNVIDGNGYIKESMFTEVTASDYARLEVANTTATFSAPQDGVVTNAIQFEFPESTSAWGVVYAIGVYDAPTGGNLRYISNLEEARTIENKTSLILKAGGVEFSEVDVKVTP